MKNVGYQYQTYTRQSGFIGSLKDFGKRKSVRLSALEDINISIAKGEIVGLLGPNGARKTTLLKVMTGILEQSQGEIVCNGKIPFKKERDFLKKIGVVLGQKSQLIWDLPATETLRMLQVMYDLSKDIYDVKVREMVQMLNVEDKLHTPVRKLTTIILRPISMIGEFFASFLGQKIIYILFILVFIALLSEPSNQFCLRVMYVGVSFSIFFLLLATIANIGFGLFKFGRCDQLSQACTCCLEDCFSR